VKTNIHFPSDISLLFDSLRSAIKLTSTLCEKKEQSGWRQRVHILRTLKKLMRKVQKSKTTDKTADKENIKGTHHEYVKLSQHYIDKVKISISQISKSGDLTITDLLILMSIERYLKDADKQIDLINRRVFFGEKIANKEKIHSIYERHTRWISKGKAGVLVEFGLPTTVLKDQFQFFLDYKIMETETDVEVPVELISKVKANFSNISSCSFDKGYWSPLNKQLLSEQLDTVILPKKGRRNKVEEAEEKSEEFVKLRKAHSSIESSINGLDHCGLDKCRDKGINGFRRCVGLSIVARNIHRIGQLLKEKEEKRIKRKSRKNTV
jgi:hypothetical protein